METIIAIILLFVSWGTKDPMWAIAAGVFALANNLYSTGNKLCDKLDRKDV